MKEATGELSTTVIVIVAIALISGLFAGVLYPMIRNSIILGNACNNSQGTAYSNDDGSYIDCTSKDSAGKYTCKYEKGGQGSGITASKVCE